LKVTSRWKAWCLRHAAQCPEKDHLACPKFQWLMKLSAAGALGEKQDRTKAFAAD